MPALVALLLLAALGGGLHAHDQYAKLPFPPYEVYEVLSQSAEASDFATLSKIVKKIAPFMAELERSSGKALSGMLDNALRARDARGTRNALMQLFFADLELNLTQAIASSAPGDRTKHLKMAFVVYHSISPFVSSGEPVEDRMLRAEFKAANRAAGQEFDERCRAILSRLSPIIERQGR